MSVYEGYRRFNRLSPPDRRAKLTPQQRVDIVLRKMEGVDPKELALEYKVTASYIRAL